MKKSVLTFAIVSIMVMSIFAQAPHSFKYQAIARDIEGNVLSNQDVSIRINLIQGNEVGKIVYSETHNTMTNQFGIINLEIGNGIDKTGEFSDIEWGLSRYFINIEIDINGGSNYKSMGVSQLLSVPYALYAETSGNDFGPESATSWTDGISEVYLTNSGWNVGIGTTTPVSKLHVIGTGVNAVYERNISTAAGPANRFYKSRGSAASKTQVFASDNLGQFQFWGMGDDGSYDIGATIKAVAENTRTGTDLFDVAASIQFLTTNTSFNWGERMRITADGDVGIGTSVPGSNVSIYENNTDLNPALLINQAGSGDAGMLYLLSSVGAAGTYYSVGIDADDNTNFKITNSYNLGSIPTPGYADPSTMLRIHNENPRPGIVDINHQSRARVYLTDPNVFIPPYAWLAIPFDATSYDEHGEWPASTASPVTTFTALEEGYYQVNARTEFSWDGFQGSSVGGYCSIAIFKTDQAGLTSMYAQGNNLDLSGGYVLSGGTDFLVNNNAPNVSDVVYLKASEKIEIRVYHTCTVIPAGGPGPGLYLNVYDQGGTVSPAITYASIHKSS